MGIYWNYVKSLKAVGKNMKYEIPTPDNVMNVNESNYNAIAELTGKVYSISILTFSKAYLISSFKKSNDFHKYFKTVEG